MDVDRDYKEDEDHGGDDRDGEAVDPSPRVVYRVGTAGFGFTFLRRDHIRH